MPSHTVECVVLKSKNFKDADKIFTFYSRGQGKVSAIAKGVRKITSRRAGNLDTLNHVKVGIHTGASSIGIVTEAKTLNSFRNIKKSLEVATQAYYVAKLVDRFVEEEEENRELFDLLVEVLGKLNAEDDSFLPVVHFEIRFMRILGYRLHLEGCVACKKTFSEDWAKCKFDFERGGFICGSCRGGIEIPKDVALTLNRIALGSFSKVPSDSHGVGGVVKRYIREKLGDVAVF